MARRILLHVCCGPCAIYPVQALRDQGLEVSALFHNPNIHPLSEYLRRRRALEQVAENLDLPVIYKDDEYDPAEYFRRTAFREDNRCFHCYQMRLSRSAQIAARGGFKLFTTSLLYSKFQKHETIRQVGLDAAAGVKSAFFYQDFRDGWKQGVETSKAWGVYRQQYCGCLYSEFERYAGELAAARAGQQPPG
ncbi:MAG: epoxyqueuosine reductase QueH [Desulfovibrionaceae bacterium]|nr:epoxyqueuosine reductase QueH [Desulfovibrionaceae bacterium]MDD4951941.1 epoxyqueuosine reductase QueH [Desulfovibrionaceae bacterium]